MRRRVRRGMRSEERRDGKRVLRATVKGKYEKGKWEEKKVKKREVMI